MMKFGALVKLQQNELTNERTLALLELQSEPKTLNRELALGSFRQEKLKINFGRI